MHWRARMLLLAPVSPQGVALAFLLPFAEMSCQKKAVVTLNGYETAFGKEVEARMPPGPLIDLRQRGGGDTATLTSASPPTLACAAAGGILCLLDWRGLSPGRGSGAGEAGISP